MSDDSRTNNSEATEERSLSTTTTTMDASKNTDQTKASDQTDAANNQQKQKKSSFQITQIINKAKGKDSKDDADVADELDETNTEDISSGLLDSSKMTDADQEPSSADTIHSPGPPGGEDIWPSSSATSTNKLPASATEPKEKVTDTHSRFKIVKIESKDRSKRGRWICMDFTDPEHTEKLDGHGTDSSNVAGSVYYIPGVDEQSKNLFAAAIVYNEGHPVLEPNPLKSPLYMSDGAFQKVQFFLHPWNNIIQTNNFPASNQLPTGVCQSLPPAGSMVPGTMPSGTLPVSTVRAGTLSSVTPATSNLSASTLPSGTLLGATGVAMSFAHGGLLHNSLPATSAANELVKAVASSKPFANQLHSASDVGSNSPTSIVEEQGCLGDSHSLSAFPDNDQRSLAKCGSGQTSKRTSQTSPLLAMVSATMMNPLSVLDIDESGTSSVAIDNKIEQAMDLVKSHLMFAVREEVEVLKEQIKELLEKNNQLEYENSILRADASLETLAKLQTGQP